jgi:phage terminase Nu1 subunit (DNA packaging protein)
VHKHPTPGVPHSKPRVATSNGKPANKAEVQRLSREYLEIRNQQMRAKTFLAEISAAARRNELIEKRLVVAQASYLFIAIRQKVLQLPTTYARRLVGLNEREIGEVLKGAAHSILNEIKDLPGKVSDPNWLESLEEKDA